jgi:hypothetical protein
MTRRRPALLAAVLVALVGALGPGVAAPALAASPGLTIVGDARYDVDPDHGAVHVSVKMTAVNHLSDTKTRLYYFDRAYLAVPPNTTGFRIVGAGGPKVRVAASKPDHTLLRIDFGARLGSKATRGLQLTFDIRDPGGEPMRDTRIGTSLVTFGAWAYASEGTPGGSVTVVFPPGYSIDARSDQLGEPTTDAAGRTVYASGRLAQPLAFFAYFVADKPSAFTTSTRTVDVGGRPLDVTIRAWPDDPAWAERTGDLVEQGVPWLSSMIGLPWVTAQPFVVSEAINSSGAPFAGRYDPDAATIEIAYYADPLVVLHETAHAWFDGGLLADRWANEGFATLYAVGAAHSLGIDAGLPAITPERQAAGVPLNAWAPVGENEPTTEDYGYAASAELARLVAERAGPTGLASIWQAAHDGVAAYQPAGLRDRDGGSAMPGSMMAGEPAGSDAAPTEMADGPPDWRGLLDLLEDRTGKKYDDLWRTWVVRHEEASLLDARAEARRQYDAVVQRAGEWRLPEVVRQAMRAWQFDQATELLTAADRALDDRDEVQAKASAAGLALPSTLEAAFEGDRGFAAASAEAEAELAAIRAYDQAAAARPVDPGAVEQIGLWGTTPAVDIEQAKAAFVAGDLRGSVDASAAAYVAWDGARDAGRNRVMTILAAAIAALVAVAFVVNGIRGVAARRASSRNRRAGTTGPAARPSD